MAAIIEISPRLYFPALNFQSSLTQNCSLVSAMLWGIKERACARLGWTDKEENNDFYPSATGRVWRGHGGSATWLENKLLVLFLNTYLPSLSGPLRNIWVFDEGYLPVEPGRGSKSS